MRRLPLLPRLASRGYRRRPTAIARSCVPRHCEVGTRHLDSDLGAAGSVTPPSRPARRLPTLPPCGAVLAVCDPPRLLHSDLRSAGVRPRGRSALLDSSQRVRCDAGRDPLARCGASGWAPAGRGHTDRACPRSAAPRCGAATEGGDRGENRVPTPSRRTRSLNDQTHRVCGKSPARHMPGDPRAPTEGAPEKTGGRWADTFDVVLGRARRDSPVRPPTGGPAARRAERATRPGTPRSAATRLETGESVRFDQARHRGKRSTSDAEGRTRDSQSISHR